MGMFDSFYTKDGQEVQLKAGSCTMERYDIGDPCELPDGIYHALFDDWVVINAGVVCDVGDKDKVQIPCNLPHYDKWGESLE